MNSKPLNDSVFEALFRQAVIENFDDDLNSIPSDDILRKTHSFSKEFELRMNRIFNTTKRKETLANFYNHARKVAVVTIFIISSLFGLLLLYPEVRAAVSSVFIQWYEQFTSFNFNQESEAKENISWKPDYLPDGFTLNNVNEYGKTTNISYINGMGDEISITFRPSGNSTNMSVDNENHDIEKCLIDGNEAYAVCSKSPDFDNGIIWSMHGYTFDIWSKLSVDEIAKVAESIKDKNTF